MICDLAETYNIFDYKGLPPTLVATFLCGLRDNSRTKMKISGQRITLDQTLMARMVDELAFISWSKTKDGMKNRNRPESVTMKLMNPEKETEKDINRYECGEDFDRAWREITGG